MIVFPTRGWDLPHGSRLDTVRSDPAASARTGIGPTAYGEFERVFGRATARWPSHRVTDGLDQFEVLLDRGLLLIHPRCAALKAAFQNYTRAGPAAATGSTSQTTPSTPTRT